MTVEKFVYDPNSSEAVAFEIESYALKKALAKKVTEIYMATGIFTEFSRADPICSVKKTKNFKQAHFLRDIKGGGLGLDDSILGTGLGFQGAVGDELEEHKATMTRRLRGCVRLSGLNEEQKGVDGLSLLRRRETGRRVAPKDACAEWLERLSQIHLAKKKNPSGDTCLTDTKGGVLGLVYL